MMSAANKVVVRYRNGRLVKGTTCDFLPAKPVFHILTGDADQALEVAIADLKAVFFVKRLEGDPNYNEYKDLPEQKVASLGKKIAVKFQDGELLSGYTHSYTPSAPGFFVTPVDPRSNNIRVFVVKDAVRELRLGIQAEELAKGRLPA